MALFPMTQFDLPNVSNYDSDLRELLAYYEQLVNDYNSIVSNYNELVESQAALTALVNDFMRNVDALVAEYVGEALEPINGRVDSLNDAVARLHAQDQRILELIDEKDSALYMRMFELVTDNFGQLLAITQDLQNQIDALSWELPNVFNPAAGYDTSINEALMDLWDALRSGAYTAETWDRFGATASELDGVDQTALWWDTQSGSFFDRSEMCRNPLTGEIEPICVILQDLAAAATENLGLTASAFDASNIDASTYEDLDLSAYQYDFKGSIYIN